MMWMPEHDLRRSDPQLPANRGWGDRILRSRPAARFQLRGGENDCARATLSKTSVFAPEDCPQPGLAHEHPLSRVRASLYAEEVETGGSTETRCPLFEPRAEPSVGGSIAIVPREGDMTCRAARFRVRALQDRRIESTRESVLDRPHPGCFPLENPLPSPVAEASG